MNNTGSVLTLRESLWAAGLFGVILLLLYSETTLSMVSIWSRSDTFAHGFLILPISLWLVWNRRDYLRPIQPVPAPWVALLLIPGAAAWLLAWVVDVLVIQQLALVGMLVVGCWAILGHRLAANLAFPLLFLFFAVPVGEGLIEPMMEFTATTTVWMVRATGIPVYREGLYFALPSGLWSVVEACSGVRYIIASLTVGTLFAYLTYRSWWRRALFVVISAVIPIFANTLRAYIIVMLGHMSDMTIATGADHLVYGWVFFGAVIFVLFWIGAMFREDLAPVPGAESPPPGSAARRASLPYLLASVAAVLLAVALGPLTAASFSADSASQPRSPVLPEAAAGWQREEGASFAWLPASRVGGQRQAVYSRDDQSLMLTVQYADGSFATGDVIGSNRLFAWPYGRWQVIGSGTVETGAAVLPARVEEAVIRGQEHEFLAWSWYQVGDRATQSDYAAKLLEAAGAFGLAEPGVYRVIVTSTFATEPGASREVMSDFLAAYGAAIQSALREPAAD